MNSIRTIGVALVALACNGALHAQQVFEPEDATEMRSGFAPTAPMPVMPIIPAIADSPYRNTLMCMSPCVLGTNVSRGGCHPMAPGPCCYGPGACNTGNCWGWGCNWGYGAGACGAGGCMSGGCGYGGGNGYFARVDSHSVESHSVNSYSGESRFASGGARTKKFARSAKTQKPASNQSPARFVAHWID